MIQVIKQISADNADVLAGTDLENIKESGILELYAASSQADTELTVTSSGEGTPVRKQVLQQKTNGVVSLSDDIPLTVPVSVGKYIVDVNIVTGATVNIIAAFTPDYEME